MPLGHTGDWVDRCEDSLSPLLYVPGQSGNDTDRRKDGCRPLTRIITSLELPGQGIRLGLARPRTVGEGEVEPSTEKRPAGLREVSLLAMQKFSWLVQTEKGFPGTQPMPPLLQGHPLPAALYSHSHILSQQETS